MCSNVILPETGKPCLLFLLFSICAIYYTLSRQLIERLDKPERKLVLRIIDAQNLMIEQRSVDSFICGFHLAWEMANELNHYMEERPEPEDDPGPDALA